LPLLGLKGLKARLRGNFSRNLKGNVDKSIARKVACYKQQRILQTDFEDQSTLLATRNAIFRCETPETRKEDVTPAVLFRLQLVSQRRCVTSCRKNCTV